MAAHAIDRRIPPLALVVRRAASAAACCLALQLALTSLAYAGNETQPPPEGRIVPGLEPVDLTLADGAWSKLFDALADAQPVRSTFAEARQFSFRKVPVVVHGEMRFARDLGLSLHYSEPKSRTIVVDEKGILMRDDRGRSRQIPAGRAAAQTPAALLPVMGFNRQSIVEAFAVRGARTDTQWWLSFTPRDVETREAVGTIYVTGNDETVERIDFGREDGPEVTITIESTEKHVTFDEAERREWFR